MNRSPRGRDKLLPAARQRPALHFSPRRGWVNDPYGIHWNGSEYHMYYQAIPDRTSWAPECAWGHAVSDDLVVWREKSPALVPQPFELGCWSGTVTTDDAAGLVAFYSRTRAHDAGLSQIAVARQVGDTGRLRSALADVVIPGPPPGTDVTEFRDPFVWRTDTGWAMLVGAGRADGTGAVLIYTASDLGRWNYAGVLSEGLTDTTRPDQPEVWECPQLVRIGGHWVLIVSVMKNQRADRVAAAVGTLDGHRFVHSGWNTFALGDIVYATSVFHDRAGLPCSLSWLREAPDHDPAARDWAGAYSVVTVLGVDAGSRVTVSPHPEVSRAAPSRPDPPSPTQTHCLDLADLASAVRVTLTASGLRALDVRRADRLVMRIAIRPGDATAEVVRPGREPQVLHRPGGSGDVDVLLDADVVEVFAGGDYGVWRLP